MKRTWSPFVLIAWLGLSHPAAAILLGQVDDFQSGSLQGWTGGSQNINQPNGGPGGVGDRYMQISSGGANLGTFNATQWAGNYAAAAVGRVTFDLSNFGPDPVSLRVMIMTAGCDGGATGCTAWTSTNATVLPAGVGWVKAEFSLLEPDLTRVRGLASYATTVSAVERLLIHQDAGPPDPPGVASFVNAVLGIDNVTALPEPPRDVALAALCALSFGLRTVVRRGFPGVDRGPARKRVSVEL
jgi:hypothetical protein